MSLSLLYQILQCSTVKETTESLLKMGRRLELSKVGESEPLWLELELLR